MGQVQVASAGTGAAGTAAPSRRRVAAFDIAKAIAIVAVVVGHSDLLGVTEGVRDFCFSFHMPLFFILSGYFCKASTPLDRGYVAKCAKALLVPYAVTCLIVVALSFVKTMLFLTPADAFMRVRDFTLAALWGAGAQDTNAPGLTVFIGAVWFLLALFWAKLFLAAANRAPYTPVVVLALFAVGYCACKYLWLPFGILQGMCATLFLYIGQKAREADLFAPGRISPLLWAAMAITWLYCAVFCGKLYMVGNYYGAGVFDVVGACCGTFVIVKACFLLEARLPRVAAPLALLGRNTLPVFCMHLVEIDVFPWVVLSPYLAALPGPLVVWGLGLRTLIIAAMVAVLYALRPLCRVYFPGSARARKS